MTRAGEHSVFVNPHDVVPVTLYQHVGGAL